LLARGQVLIVFRIVTCTRSKTSPKRTRHDVTLDSVLVFCFNCLFDRLCTSNRLPIVRGRVYRTHANSIIEKRQLNLDDDNKHFKTIRFGMAVARASPSNLAGMTYAPQSIGNNINSNVARNQRTTGVGDRIFLL